MNTTEKTTAVVPVTPAQKVIDLFGGVRPLARELGRNPSSIARWRRAKTEGGTGGAVPSSMQGRLLALAKARGLPLAAEDLILQA
jgi:transposase-like protein